MRRISTLEPRTPSLELRAARLAPRNSAPYQVTWWDPHVLNLGAVSSFGLRREDLIVKDGDMFAVEERLADYERWRDERAEVIAQGSRQALRVKTATAWAAEAAAARDR